jgi:hypothetical protein
MLRPSGIVALSALVLVVPLLVASDGQAGSALVAPTKTTGITLTATIVIDVTQTVSTDQSGNKTYFSDADTGLTSIRVQKASTVTAAIFSSSYIAGANWTDKCGKGGTLPNTDSDVLTTAAIRFTGLIDTLVGDEEVLKALFLPFGTPHRAAIVAQDYVTCTSTQATSTQPSRHFLSFDAVIQFCVPPSVTGKFCPQ